MIYLDNSATTMVRPEVRDVMLPFLSEQFGNPSSMHSLGRTASQALDVARQQVSSLLNCSPDEVFFSPCATYSNNAAILGRARQVESEGGGRHLITCNIEHPACLGPAKYLEANGWSVTYLRVDSQGLISAEQLRAAIRKDTSMVSLMWANNEIGCLQPIEELAQICKESGVFFHTDAVQIVGKLAIDVEKVPVDTLALSGHKFYAPKGIGVLYKRREVSVLPVFFGGGQECKLFPGTESVANIVGIGKAAELAKSELVEVQGQLRRMQTVLAEGLCALDNVRLTGPADMQKRLPGHVSVVIRGVEGEALVMQCDLKGLCISSASACHKGIMQPSHVVTALGISDEAAIGSLRITAGTFNTEAECASAIAILRKVITSLSKDKVSHVR